jgi:hypothetical protein
MQQLDRRKSMRVAQDFLTRCFAPGESIALLLRRENPASVTQRVVLLERAVAPRYLGWLAHENSTGANIYVAANPLRTGSRKRTKGSIAAVRHLYIDNHILALEQRTPIVSVLYLLVAVLRVGAGLAMRVDAPDICML